MSSCNRSGCNSCGCNNCNTCDSCNSCNNRNSCNNWNNWSNWNNWNNWNNCNNCNNCSNCNSCSSCNNWNNWNNWNWDGLNWGNWNWGNWNWNNWGCNSGCSSNCPFSQWIHRIGFNHARFSFAGHDDGPTLVIHQIVLEAGCEQSCTPRNFHIRITGPSYPCGEIFTLRAGSCLELDEPLVISGLEPGQYEIELLHSCARDFISTLTGPVCGRCVTVNENSVPTVVTIVSRRRSCRNLRGCNSCSGCGNCGCSSC